MDSGDRERFFLHRRILLCVLLLVKIWGVNSSFGLFNKARGLRSRGQNKLE
jgi:hypothetical protein